MRRRCLDTQKIAEFSYYQVVVTGKSKGRRKWLRRAWTVTYLKQDVLTLPTLKEAKDFIYEKALS